MMRQPQGQQPQPCVCFVPRLWGPACAQLVNPLLSSYLLNLAVQSSAMGIKFFSSFSIILLSLTSFGLIASSHSIPAPESVSRLLSQSRHHSPSLILLEFSVLSIGFHRSASLTLVRPQNNAVVCLSAMNSWVCETHHVLVSLNVGKQQLLKVQVFWRVLYFDKSVFIIILEQTCFSVQASLRRQYSVISLYLNEDFKTKF